MTMILREPPRQPEVLALLRESDEFALSLYPPEECYLLDIDELERDGVTFFVARAGSAAVGIAALVDHRDGSAELKRMFVSDRARGLGAGRNLLRAVEADALAAGVSVLRLETGPLQVAAISLYERSGYRRIPGFGQYVGEFSVCYEKVLA